MTLSGTVRPAVGRDIWSKILGKTSVKKLVNKGGCFGDWAGRCILSTGVILAYLLVFDMTPAVLF